jgi:hypothetical protein
VSHGHSKNGHAFYCGIKFFHHIADPDLVCARQEAMEATRHRLQTEHNEKAKLNAEKVKQVCGYSLLQISRNDRHDM